MLDAIFDSKDADFGQCTICYEKRVSLACNECGNCICSSCKCNMRTNQCPSCRTSSNYVTIRL